MWIHELEITTTRDDVQRIANQYGTGIKVYDLGESVNGNRLVSLHYPNGDADDAETLLDFTINVLGFDADTLLEYLRSAARQAAELVVQMETGK